MMNTGREPATIRIAAYRSSPRYALHHGRRRSALTICTMLCLLFLPWSEADTSLFWMTGQSGGKNICFLTSKQNLSPISLQRITIEPVLRSTCVKSAPFQTLESTFLTMMYLCTCVPETTFFSFLSSLSRQV